MTELPPVFKAQGWREEPVPSWHYATKRVGETWWRNEYQDLLTYNYHGRQEWEIEVMQREPEINGPYVIAILRDNESPEELHLRYITGLLTGDWGIGAL